MAEQSEKRAKPTIAVSLFSCGIIPAHIQLERANLATPAPPRTDEHRNHPGTTITDTLLSDPRPLLGRQKLSLSWSARMRMVNGAPREVRRNAFAICAHRSSTIIARLVLLELQGSKMWKSASWKIQSSGPTPKFDLKNPDSSRRIYEFENR